MSRRLPFLDRLTLASVLSLYVVCLLLYLVLNASAEALPVSKGIFPVSVDGDPRLLAALGYSVAPSDHAVRVRANRVALDFPPGVQGAIVGGFLADDLKAVNGRILSRRGAGFSAPILVDEDSLRQDVLLNATGPALAAPPAAASGARPASSGGAAGSEEVDARLDEYFSSGEPFSPEAPAAPPSDVGNAVLPVSFSPGEELREPGVDALAVVRQLFAPLVLVLPLIAIANLFALIVSQEKSSGLLEALLPVEGGWSYLASRMLPLVAAAMGLEGALLLSLGCPWLDMVSIVALLLPVAAVYFLANLAVVLAVASTTQVSNIIILANMAISAYFIIPAFFLTVSERAALSPLAAVVQRLNGLPVDSDAALRALAFSLLLAALLAYWIALLFRGERVVASASLRTTLSSALARHAARPGFMASFCLVYGASAVVAGLAFQVVSGTALARWNVLFPLVVALFVLLEEALKAWPLVALDLPPSVSRHAVAHAAAIGAAFFATEKFLQLLFIRTVLGVDYLNALLQALFQTRAIYTTLLVHPLATALFAHLYLVRRTGPWVALAAAFALHVGYNALVLSGWWV